MYTKEPSDCGRYGWWDIIDPAGDFICTVINEFAADALLSHLNR